MTFTFNGVAQIVVYFLLLLLITKPLGLYLIAVFEKKSTWFEPVFRPVERVLYKAAGVDERREHDWKIYAVAMLVFEVISTVPLYVFERERVGQSLRLRGHLLLPDVLRSVPLICDYLAGRWIFNGKRERLIAGSAPTAAPPWRRRANPSATPGRQKIEPGQKLARRDVRERSFRS